MSGIPGISHHATTPASSISIKGVELLLSHWDLHPFKMRIPSSSCDEFV
jgi:hypothetical protein